MKPGIRLWLHSLRRKRQKAVPCSSALKGLAQAREALHGPPPTPEQLQEAEAAIARQKARDFGAGGLF